MIEVEGDPVINGVCHCRNCKKRTGSAFGWSAYFRDEQIRRKDGNFIVYAIMGRNPQERSFCATCGSTVYWTAGDFPGQTGVAGDASSTIH